MGIKKLYLLIDEELVKKAGDHGIIISRFLENKLKEYFIFIDEIIKKQMKSTTLEEITKHNQALINMN